jgi:hypothetical protein
MRFHTEANRRLLLLSAVFFLLTAVPFLATAASEKKPVAEVLGKAVYWDELTPSDSTEQKKKLDNAAYASWLASAQEKKLQSIVWSSVFGDYTAKLKIEPTQQEIASQISNQERFIKEDRVRREKDRQNLIKELALPGITEARRKQAQQYLDTLNSLHGFDERRDKEQSSPEGAKRWQEAQLKVSAVWVKQWKVNQSLFREFGGRIIFQQAGWEPIDAYRKLLEQYETRKAFVVHDPAMHEAVYSYFKLKFTYADEKMAKFYFEKPYWERTPQEIRAAGF